MMRFLPEILLFSLFVAATVHAHTPGDSGGPPRFEDYPIALKEAPAAAAAEAPAPAPLVFATPDARRFRARLRAAAQQDPNFAGHYVLTTWDCGPQCLVGAAVDVRNGEVTWLPEVTLHASLHTSDAELLQASEPVRFRKDSRLIAFEGARQQNAEDHGVHYYEIRGNELVHVRSIAKQKGNP